MTYLDRLLSIGISYDCALDIIHFFTVRNDMPGLEQYIEDVRARKMKVSDR